MNLFKQNLRLDLVRPNLLGLPESPAPSGYSMRWFKPGDAAHWLRIQRDAEPFNDITPELFTRQFGSDLSRLENCQCYLQDELGRVMGTCTAWTDPERAQGPWGRVLWLAVTRKYQGRGLSKPILATICNRLHELGHTRACVITSTGRLPAVSLYLQFGFQPVIQTDSDRAIWNRVLEVLKASGRLKEAAAAA